MLLAQLKPESLDGATALSPAAHMRIALNVVASLLLLIGVVWFLQGINILPGSFMTGQVEWAVYGALATTTALFLFRFANPRPR